MDWFSKIMEAAKLPTKFVAVIFLVSSVLLFIPDDLLALFKLNDFSIKFGIYIGITALASGAMLFVELLSYIWSRINRKITSAKLKENRLARLQILDPSEKSVLREFFIQGQNSLKLPMDQPVVAGLINAGILQFVGSHGRVSISGMLISMKIADFVRENLIYELIDLPNGEPSSQEIHFLKNNRPPFIDIIQREKSLSNGW